MKRILILSAGIGSGHNSAAGLAAEGKIFTETEQAVRTARKRVNQFVTVHSLDSLKRAGRVTASSAFFGNLMGVKLILISDADGVQTPIKKVRGRLRSLEEIADLLEGNIKDASAQTVCIAHADCDPEEVSNLKNMVNDIIKPKHIVSSDTDCYDTATAAIALTEPEKHSSLIILEGKCADSKITADIRSYISEKYPRLETYINYGGQDIYDYIKYMSVCSCVSSLSCPVILAILGAACDRKAQRKFQKAEGGD